MNEYEYDMICMLLSSSLALRTRMALPSPRTAASTGSGGSGSKYAVTVPPLSDEVIVCQKQITELQARLAQTGVAESARRLMAECKSVTSTPVSSKLRPRRKLARGHWGKVYALSWFGDNKHLVSAAQDGNLIIWNSHNTNKAHMIPLKSPYVMTVDASPTGRFVASGGLDNTITIHKLPEKAVAHAVAAASGITTPLTAAQAAAATNGTHTTHAQMIDHEGYISCIRWRNDDELLSCSGDATIMVWDIEAQVCKHRYKDHVADVMTVAYAPQHDTDTSKGAAASHVFVSGSIDGNAKLWDTRVSTGRALRTFRGHESDINGISWHPSGYAFATASDDSTIRLWDIRAGGHIQHYSDTKLLCGITSVAFSGTGRLIVAGYDDYNGIVWDTTLATRVDQLSGHDNRVTCVSFSNDGKGLATGSWDSNIFCWS